MIIFNAFTHSVKSPYISHAYRFSSSTTTISRLFPNRSIFSTTGSMIAYPTQLDSYAPSMAPEDLSFPVSDVAAEYVKNEMIIYATLKLPGGSTKFNHVWQEGSSVANDVPQAHSTSGDNIESLGTIDFQWVISFTAKGHIHILYIH